MEKSRGWQARRVIRYASVTIRDVSQINTWQQDRQIPSTLTSDSNEYNTSTIENPRPKI